jgi:hypothetical protein
MGILVAVDMMTIALSAMTFLPAVIMVLPPKLEIDSSDEYVCTDPLVEEDGVPCEVTGDVGGQD